MQQKTTRFPLSVLWVCLCGRTNEAHSLLRHHRRCVAAPDIQTMFLQKTKRCLSCCLRNILLIHMQLFHIVYKINSVECLDNSTAQKNYPACRFYSKHQKRLGKIRLNNIAYPSPLWYFSLASLHEPISPHCTLTVPICSLTQQLQWMHWDIIWCRQPMKSSFFLRCAALIFWSANAFDKLRCVTIHSDGFPRFRSFSL